MKPARELSRGSYAEGYKLLAEEILKLAETARDAYEERALLEIAWGFAQLACETIESIVPERGANQSKLH